MRAVRATREARLDLCFVTCFCGVFFAAGAGLCAGMAVRFVFGAAAAGLSALGVVEFCAASGHETISNESSTI